MLRHRRPGRNGRVEASNLPWIIESKRLADELKIKKALSDQ